VPLRVAGVGRALLLIHPGSVTDMLGLAIGVPIYLWQRWRYRVPAKT